MNADRNTKLSGKEIALWSIVSCKKISAKDISARSMAVIGALGAVFFAVTLYSVQYW